MPHSNKSHLVRPILILVAAFLSLTVVSCASTTAIPLDPRQTYLLTTDDFRALDTIPIDLGSLGFRAG